MRKNRITLTILLLSLILAALLVTACTEKEEVLATVNGQDITRSQLDDVLKMVRLVTPDVDAMLEDDGFTEYFEDTFLKMLVDNALIAMELESLELAVDPEELEEVYQTFRGQLLDELYRDEEELNERLQELNLEAGAIKGLLFGEVAANTLFDHVLKDLTDEELQKYAEENGLLEVASSVVVYHILFPEGEKDEALAALERLDGGEDFSVVAKLSECPSGKNSGGGLGKMYENDPNWDADFRAAAFGLAVGEVSEPVKTRFGWHIILVTEREEGYTKVFEEEKEGLRFEREQMMIDDFFNDLWTKAEIEFFI